MPPSVNWVWIGASFRSSPGQTGTGPEIARICRDPDDDHWLALAKQQAVPLCTGDKDLLSLRGCVPGLDIWPSAELVGRLTT